MSGGRPRGAPVSTSRRSSLAHETADRPGVIEGCVGG